MDDVFFLDVPLRFWSKSSSRIQHGCIHPWVGLVGSVVTWGFSGLKYEIMNREDLTPLPPNLNSLQNLPKHIERTAAALKIKLLMYFELWVIFTFDFDNFVSQLPVAENRQTDFTDLMLSLTLP